MAAETAGLVRNLQRQVRIKLAVNARHVTTYVADFTYDDASNTGWTFVVEDTKGLKTPEYKIKRSLFRAIFGFDIRET